MEILLFFLVGIVLLIVIAKAESVQKANDANDAKENQSGSSDYIYKRNEVRGEIGGTNLDRFYIESVLSGCDEVGQLDNPQIAQKIELLAKKYNLSVSNGVSQVFQEARNAHLMMRGEDTKAQLDKLRNAERAEYNVLTKYANYTGREKRKIMLGDQAAELRAQAKKSSDSAESYMRLGYQKESDWAIMGGIANGLAGPAAGIATALDTQARNAQIRAQNQVFMNAAMPLYSNMMDSSRDMKSMAETLEKRKEETDEKLISEIPSEEVFKLLSFQNTTVKVSETGAFRVGTKATTARKPTIGDFPAVIDGTVLAHVKTAAGKEIGVVKLVIPVDGISQSANLIGIGLNGAKNGENYTVSFSPDNLWIIEQ